MSDLTERLKGVIKEKLAIARAAEPYYDGRDLAGELIMEGFDRELAEFAASHDPILAIRQHEAALRVLERHTAREFGRPFAALCEGCSITDGSDVLRFVEWPCQNVRDLADAHGVPVDTEKTPGETDDESQPAD